MKQSFRKKAPWLIIIPDVVDTTPPQEPYTDAILQYIKDIWFSALGEWSSLNGFDPPHVANYRSSQEGSFHHGSVMHILRLKANMFQVAHDVYLDICINSPWIDRVHIIGIESGAYLALKIHELFKKCGTTLQNHSIGEFDKIFGKVLSGEAFESVVEENERFPLFRCVLLGEPHLPAPNLIARLLLHSKFSAVVERPATTADCALIFTDPQWQSADYDMVVVPTCTTPLCGLREQILVRDQFDALVVQLLPQIRSIWHGESDIPPITDLKQLQIERSTSSWDARRLVRLKVKAGYIRRVIDSGGLSPALRLQIYSTVRSWPDAKEIGLGCLSVGWDSERQQLEDDLGATPGAASPTSIDREEPVSMHVRDPECES